MKKIVLLAAAAAGTFFLTGCGQSPASVTQEYAEAILEADVAAANECSVTTKHEDNKELVKKIAESSDDKDKFARIKFIKDAQLAADGDVIIDGEFAIVFSAEGAPIAALKKVNDKWKIMEFGM